MATISTTSSSEFFKFVNLTYPKYDSKPIKELKLQPAGKYTMQADITTDLQDPVFNVFIRQSGQIMRDNAEEGNYLEVVVDLTLTAEGAINPTGNNTTQVLIDVQDVFKKYQEDQQSLVCRFYDKDHKQLEKIQLASDESQQPHRGSVYKVQEAPQPATEVLLQCKNIEFSSKCIHKIPSYYMDVEMEAEMSQGTLNAVVIHDTILDDLEYKLTEQEGCCDIYFSANDIVPGSTQKVIARIKVSDILQRCYRKLASRTAFDSCRFRIHTAGQEAPFTAEYYFDKLFAESFTVAELDETAESETPVPVTTRVQVQPGEYSTR